MIADIILFFHSLIAAFLACGLILIPIGGILQWNWVRNRILRQVHLWILIFITIESMLGLTCPLSFLEAYFRDTTAQNNFIGFYLAKILYWDLPPLFFIVLYLACVLWTLTLWRIVQPKSSGNVQKTDTEN